MEAVSTANVAAEALVSRVAVPLAVLGTFVFILIIPALREKTLWAHFTDHRTLRGHVKFLLDGGWRFMLAYLSGWTFLIWAFALYTGCIGDIFFGEETVGSLTIGVMTFIGQVLISSACLVYPSPKRKPGEPKPFMIKDTVLFKAFAAMNVGLAIIGATLAGLVALQKLDTSYNGAFQSSPSARTVHVVPGNATYLTGEVPLETVYHSPYHLTSLSALCCLLSVVLTHGILGRWYHEGSGKSWSFFQPFVGGFNFVTTQILAWVCVAACIGLVFEKALRFFLPDVGLITADDDRSDSFLSLSAGVTGVVAEVFMIVSITMFDGPGMKAGMSKSASSDDIKSLGGRSSPKLGPMSREGSRTCLSSLGMEPIDLGPSAKSGKSMKMSTSDTHPHDFSGIVAAVHDWMYPRDSRYFWYREGKVNQSELGVKYVNLVLFSMLGGTAGSGLLMGWVMYFIYLLRENDLAPMYNAAHFVPFALSASFFTSGIYYWSCNKIETEFYNPAKKKFAKEWKCQPDRFLSPQHHREEVVWGMFNAGWAGVLGTGIFYGHINEMWRLKLYYDVYEHGWWHFIGGFVLVFFWIDLWAYFAHRFLHQKFIYKYVHKWHHRYIAPTSFSAFGMHPIEFTIFQCGGIFCCFLFRIHVMAFLVNATYVAYHGQIDHSGIYFEGDLPWQPSTKYHDDHHKYFHLNFGQNLILWDWMFGTLRQEDRVYGEDIFVADEGKLVYAPTAKKLQ